MSIAEIVDTGSDFGQAKESVCRTMSDLSPGKRRSAAQQLTETGSYGAAF